MKSPKVFTKIILFWLLSLFWSAGCSGPTVLPATGTPAPPSPTATVSPTATLEPTITPSPLPPTATPTPSPADIFERVSPSIAYIETPLAFGSAILIEGNYLLTNAHVVWPFDEVRVVFPEGTEFEAVPVVNWDQMADLAVLGPVEAAPAEPLALVDGEGSVVGTDVYLIGYPAEVDTYPEPSLTRGLISRMREWEHAGITYFQSDATIAGGQSGGALVSAMGDVIGISGFAFADMEFALVASAADLSDRVTRLIAGEDTSGVGKRMPDYTAGERSLTARMRHVDDRFVYLVSNGCEPDLNVEVESDVDVALTLFDMSTFESQEFDDGFTGVERFSHASTAGSVHVVEVFSYGNWTDTLAIQSTCDLVALEDPDDETMLHVGEVTRGAIDYFGDVDLFHVVLREGDTVNFLVDSASIDPFISVTYPDAPGDTYHEDDDSGKGLFGLDADLSVRAPHTGRFLIYVQDAEGYSTGGYSISVTGDRVDMPTPPAWSPTPAALCNEVGCFQTYRSDYPYTMQVEAAWENVTESDPDCNGICFSYGYNYLMLTEEDFVALLGEAGRNFTRDQYISAVLGNMGTFMPQATLQWQESTTAASGLRIDRVHYTMTEAGLIVHLEIVIAFEEGIGFSGMYIVLDNEYAEMQPVIDYSFSTLAWEP